MLRAHEHDLGCVVAVDLLTARATTTIRDPKGSGTIIGVGDHATSARKAKSLAALSALLQLSQAERVRVFIVSKG